MNAVVSVVADRVNGWYVVTRTLEDGSASVETVPMPGSPDYPLDPVNARQFIDAYTGRPELAAVVAILEGSLA